MGTLTIKDIAKICKVSTSTVSRAINDDPGINQKTKERIIRVVEEFHFVPNNSARNLKLAESNTIALICKGIGNSFFQSMYPMFESELERHGYTFILNEIGADKDDAEAAVAIAKEKRLKGVIFLGGLLDNPKVKLRQLAIPYVLTTVAVNTDAAEVGSSIVAIDDEKESFKIVDYLCKQGHKKIAIVSGRKSDFAVGDEVTKKLLADQEEFTALFATSDLAAFGAYKAISEAGKKIPEDYSVVGFDGIDLTKYMVPSLTTVAQPTEEFAKASVDLLMKAINGDTTRERLVYDAQIIERDSVKRIGGN